MIYILNQGSNCIMNKQCWNFCETASYKAEKKTVENGQNSHIYLVYCTVLFLQMVNHEQYTRYCIYDNVLNILTKYNFFHLPPPFSTHLRCLLMICEFRPLLCVHVNVANSPKLTHTCDAKLLGRENLQ